MLHLVHELCPLKGHPFPNHLMALLLLTEESLEASAGPESNSISSDDHALVCIGDLHPGTIQYALYDL